MKIIAELHTHSSDYCWHAKNTIDEQVEHAREMGFKYFASTNHGPILDDNTPTTFYMNNLYRKHEGIKFLAGMEADLRDLHGGLDVAQRDLLRLDFVIASIHTLCLDTGYPDYTNTLVKAAENPAVDCLGHIARYPEYNYDLDKVLKAVKENGKLIEINNSSIEESGRGDACGQVIDKCAELGIGCIVTSDAHKNSEIGNHSAALELIKQRSFPEELVINASEERLEAFLARRKKEKKVAYGALFVV